jgi:hypothetical protein
MMPREVAAEDLTVGETYIARMRKPAFRAW